MLHSWHNLLCTFRLRLKFSCMMELSRYPLDRQICDMQIASCKYESWYALFFLQASAISCCILNRSNFIIAAFYQLRELFTFSLKNNKRIAIALGLFGLWQTSFSFHGFTYATIYHRRSYSNDMLWKISSR